jgi:hypothetical protein
MKLDIVEKWMWRLAVGLFAAVILIQVLLTNPQIRYWLVSISKIEGVRPSNR